MEIKANPNLAESAGSNTDLRKRRLSFNSDTEASSSCNFEPVKRPRKVTRKMAEPPQSHPMSNADTALRNLDNPHLPQLLEVAADFSLHARNEPTTPPFVHVECEVVVNLLWDKHQIVMSPLQARNILNALCYQFRLYCRLMKTGVAGLSFDFNTGEPCINSSKIDMGTNLNKIVYANFRYLKDIYSSIWDYYFSMGGHTRSPSLSSGKRSRSTTKSGSTKRSKHSCPSVNDHEWMGELACKIRRIYSLDFDAPLSSNFSRVICKYYSDERARTEFMRYDDATAWKEFHSKILMDTSSN